MKASLFFLAVPALVSAAKCNADNCARALTGTANGAAQPSSRINTDCSSFQMATAYPAATTITITSGSTATTIVPDTADIVVAPSLLPSYAKAACTPSGIASARFASACSCAGVTETTTTMAIPTATIVVPVNASPVPYCNDPGSIVPQAGGCSPGCYCDARPGSNIGFCDNSNNGCSTYTRCSTDADCPGGQSCAASSPINGCGYAICFGYGGCSSSYTPSKRSLFERSALSDGSMAAAPAKKEGRYLGKRVEVLYPKFQPM